MAGITPPQPSNFVPLGAAVGGDLAGSLPNPTIGAGKVTDSHLEGGIGRDKIATVEAVRLVGGVGEPAFENSWANTGGGTRPLGFWEDDASGLVHVRGLVTRSGDAGFFEVVFTLPTGYRPSEIEYVPQLAAVGGSLVPFPIGVNSSGNVYIGADLGADATLYLSFSFRP